MQQEFLNRDHGTDRIFITLSHFFLVGIDIILWQYLALDLKIKTVFQYSRKLLLAPLILNYILFCGAVASLLTNYSNYAFVSQWVLFQCYWFFVVFSNIISNRIPIIIGIVIILAGAAMTLTFRDYEYLNGADFLTDLLIMVGCIHMISKILHQRISIRTLPNFFIFLVFFLYSFILVLQSIPLAYGLHENFDYITFAMRLMLISWILVGLCLLLISKYTNSRVLV